MDLTWSSCRPYDDILARVKYIEQSDTGLKIYCDKVEKEKKMNKNEELKNVDTIIITRDGDTVSLIAYDERSGFSHHTTCHKTTAKCGPDDIFDFNIGAKIAFDRLYEGYDMTPKPKRKLYNGLIYIKSYPGVSLKNKSICRVKDGIIQNCPFGVWPFIYEGMSDEELSKEIDDVVWGRACTLNKKDNSPMTVAHFVDYDQA